MTTPVAATSPQRLLLRHLRIGMIGGGTVGGGVVQLIQQSPLLSSCCDVVKICVKDVTKPRDYTIDPTKTTLTNNVQDILQDESINVIVEVVGGSEGIAKQAVFTSLQKGKSVVTANKALLAQHLPALQELLLLLSSLNTISASSSSASSTTTTSFTTAASSPQLLFEAAVCGGIPIIHVLQTCYSPGDQIQQIMGICNGTTNYMLWKMHQGNDYHEALREAQALGYAEADPTADVEGFDVQAKIAILTKLAFGVTLVDSETNIPRKGISSIQPIDFAFAKVLGGNNSTIKLLGVAKSQDEAGDDKQNLLQVYVAPHVVPGSHNFASVHTNGNAVRVTSRNMGPTMYTGPGAGRFPTANSVVADIYRLATNKAIDPPFPAIEGSDKWVVDTDYSGVFYLRWKKQPGEDADAIVKLGAGIEVDRMLETPSDSEYGALVTQPTTRSSMEAWCAQISGSDPLYMPILSA